LEDVICAIPKVTGCLRASSETFVYLQMTDLLLGALQFDWRDVQGNIARSSRRGEAKRNLVSFVKNQLGISPSEPILTPNARFRKKSRPVRFTAWMWRPQ